MPLLNAIPIPLTAERLVDAQTTQRRRRSRPGPVVVAAAQQAVEMALTLYTPAAVYVKLDVHGLDGEGVRVSSPDQAEEQMLRIGPHVDLLAPATELLAAVYTIGSDLEKRVDQLNRSGQTLVAYWLDCAGVMAVGAVGDALRCVAEENADEHGWGVSPAL